MSPQTHRVSAYNTSKFSENKIHDDTVARKYGFSGGLVHGVDVLAYMLYMPVAKTRPSGDCARKRTRRRPLAATLMSSFAGSESVIDLPGA